VKAPMSRKQLIEEQFKEARRQYEAGELPLDEDNATANWPLHKYAVHLYNDEDGSPELLEVFLEHAVAGVLRYEDLADNAVELERRHFPHVAEILWKVADWDVLLVDTTLRRCRCSENARRLDTQQKIVGFQPPHAPLNDQGALSAPLRETQRAIDESRAKRLSGELPTFAASVQCSNPRMIQAFNAAHYRYMDLIETLDGLARYRHVVGVHDAMNEADEQPPCYQRCLARDHQVGECAVPVSGVNRLWVMPRDDVISEAPDRIQIPVRREELEGADTDVARRDAVSTAPGNGVSRQTAIGKKPHTRAYVPIPERPKVII